MYIRLLNLIKMTLAYMNLGTAEIILILVAFIFILVIGNYGRHTALGYWGSVLLAILSTPVVAFIIISILRYRHASNRG